MSCLLLCPVFSLADSDSISCEESEATSVHSTAASEPYNILYFTVNGDITEVYIILNDQCYCKRSH